MNVKNAVYELIEELKVLESLETVILYGSAVTGEMHKKSDIDLLLIFNLDHNPETGEEGIFAQKKAIEIENKHDLDNPFSYVFFNRNENIDSDFLWEIAKDGIALYSKPELILGKKENLEPAAFISYKFGKIPHKDKMYVERKLYGYKVKKKYKEKDYVSESKGLVSEFGKKVGRATFLIKSKKIDEVTKIFDQKKVEYNLSKVWV